MKSEMTMPPTLAGKLGASGEQIEKKLSANNTTIRPISKYRAKQYNHTTMGQAMLLAMREATE